MKTFLKIVKHYVILQVLGLLMAIINGAVWSWMPTLGKTILFGTEIVLCLLYPFWAYNMEKRKTERLRSLAQEKESRRIALSEKKRAQKHARELAEQLRRRFGAIPLEATQTFDLSISLLTAANRQLDLAQTHFRLGAFDPFWTAIEQALISLGKYDTAVVRLTPLADEHRRLAKTSNDSVSSFPVSKKSLKELAASGLETVNRFYSILYTAQRDIGFTTVYHQRRNEEILISGFRNLEDAIRGMQDRIQVDIQALSDSASSQMLELGRQAEDRHREQLTQDEHRTAALLQEVKKLQNEEHRNKF